MGSEVIHAFANNAVHLCGAHDNASIAMSCKSGNNAVRGTNIHLDVRDPKNIRPFINSVKKSNKPFALVVKANLLVEVTRLLHALHQVKKTRTSVAVLLQTSVDNHFHINAAIKLWNILGIHAIEVKQGKQITRHIILP